VTFRLADVEPPPDVFAAVMATGILSVAAANHHYRQISETMGAARYTPEHWWLAVAVPVWLATLGGIGAGVMAGADCAQRRAAAESGTGRGSVRARHEDFDGRVAAWLIVVVAGLLRLARGR
jgi:hypothetical protein